MTDRAYRKEPLPKRYRHPRTHNRARAGIAALLCVLVVVAFGGLIYVFADAGRTTAAKTDARLPITSSTPTSAAAPQTTGASAKAMAPAPQPQVKPAE